MGIEAGKYALAQDDLVESKTKKYTAYRNRLDIYDIKWIPNTPPPNLRWGVKDGMGYDYTQVSEKFPDAAMTYEGTQLINYAKLDEVTRAITDPNGLARWTPNYNGVNSYVEIPAWTMPTNWEIEADVYIHDYTSSARLVSGDRSNSVWSGLEISGNYLRWRTTTEGDNAVFNITNKVGWNHIKFGSADGCRWRTNSRIVSLIGAMKVTNGIQYFFKGQISNLKLIDKENPENSRFYPGIVYSYVDPDATDVPMPQSTVLVDEWGEGEIKVDETGSFTGSFNVYNKESTPSIEAGEYYLIELEGASPTANSRVSITFNDALPWTSVFGGKGVVKIQNSLAANVRWSFNLYSEVVSNIKITKVTHGIMTNFGTTQPYVPLLGDREEYCGNRTEGADAWKRGYFFYQNQPVLAVHKSSWDDKSPSVWGDNAIIESNGKQFKLNASKSIRDIYGYTLVSDEGFQHAFQYPNTFRVIKPTDPDHPDYVSPSP